MLTFVLAILFTLGVSFCCSFLEAMVLSTTVAEVEALKRSRPRCGELWENHRTKLDDTISTILTVNTIANTLGSIIVGGLAIKLYGEAILGIISALMTFGILVFSEVIPKNLGVVYRVPMQPRLAYVIWWMRRAMAPITYLCGAAVRFFIPKRPKTENSDEEIILLAERGAKEGTITRDESRIIANALSLDDVRVGKIMTPRTVVFALNAASTIGDVFKQYPNLPFGRMPVYQKTLDNVVGLARRRDLLKAKANDQDSVLVGSLMQEVNFIPETVTAADALQLFMKSHQQLAVAVDEYGSVSGVVTLEDVFEHILGGEIFEKDDLAVDMRELARSRSSKSGKLIRKSTETKPG